MHRHLFKSGAGLSAAYLLMNAVAAPQADAHEKAMKFEAASTLNPKYDKRWKKGEDNLLIRPQFLCVLDGVGGWIEVMIDSGIMTKEFI